MGSFARRRRSLRFVDDAVEASYQAQRVAGAQRRLRAALPPLLGAWVVSMWFDFSAPQPMGTHNAIIRFAAGLPAFAVVMGVTWLASPAAFARHWHRALAFTYAALLAATVGLTWVAVGPFVPHAYIGFLLVLLLGGSLALIEAPALIGVALVACVAELIVLVLHPETTSFDISGYANWIVIGALAVVVFTVQLEAFQRRLFAQQHELEQERTRGEALLRNVMPAPIATRLKHEPDAIADHYDGVTVVFADIAGFTGIAARMSPAELVGRLDDIFSQLDDIVHRHGLEKIKTIGDQYMAVAGAPTPRPDHAAAAARVALEIARMSAAGLGGLTFRIGIASGPAIAGVIGKVRFSYDLWGDTVNLASRMESHGVPGRVQCDDRTHDLLAGAFRFEDRGVIDVKGKGAVHTYFLVEEAPPPVAKA